MKSFLKKIIPESLRMTRQRLLGNILDKEYMSLTLKETFERIYENEIWGRSDDSSDLFCSGEGSHNFNVTSVYFAAIENFLNSFEKKIDVVDLGCGDFSVGSKIRHLCNQYVACDITEPLIKRNKIKYKDINVDFRLMDITEDELPHGDVVFIRQVLQHLSNKQIIKVVKKLQREFEYIVVTEHLPIAKHFTPNLDKPAGPNIRLGLGENGSGIILTERPFKLKVKEERVLCEVNSSGGIIRTYLYVV